MSDTVFRPGFGAPLAERESFREQALTLLRQALVTGDLAPGEIYSAAAVANSLGVSRIPVREAMLTLVSEGLMEPVRNRGYRVVALSAQDRREIYELRVALEPFAMGQLASSGQKLSQHRPELAKLATRTVQCAEGGDLIGHLEADRLFHLRLMQLAGNARMTEIVMRLRDQTRRYAIRMMPHAELVSNAREHFEIVDSVIDHKSEAARAIMVKHLSHLAPDVDAGGS